MGDCALCDVGSCSITCGFREQLPRNGNNVATVETLLKFHTRQQIAGMLTAVPLDDVPRTIQSLMEAAQQRILFPSLGIQKIIRDLVGQIEGCDARIGELQAQVTVNRNRVRDLNNTLIRRFGRLDVMANDINREAERLDGLNERLPHGAFSVTEYMDTLAQILAEYDQQPPPHQQPPPPMPPHQQPPPPPMQPLHQQPPPPPMQPLHQQPPPPMQPHQQPPPQPMPHQPMPHHQPLPQPPEQHKERNPKRARS